MIDERSKEKKERGGRSEGVEETWEREENEVVEGKGRKMKGREGGEEKEEGGKGR